MPYKATKISSGPNKGKYRNTSPHGVKAKASSKKNVEAQQRLLRGIKHGWKPSN